MPDLTQSAAQLQFMQPQTTYTQLSGDSKELLALCCRTASREFAATASRMTTSPLRVQLQTQASVAEGLAERIEATDGVYMEDK